jgi:oligoribonuclease
MNRYESNLVWIDLEMTGLDIKKDIILEIACVITNNQLDILSISPSIAINYPKNDILNIITQWSLEQHNKSGLLNDVFNSKYSLEDAESIILDFIKEYTSPNEAPLCGNSIWQDKIFINKYMPKIDNYLNYRIIDVSSIKEFIKRNYFNHVDTNFIKESQHRALSDILESIKELAYYKRKFFI